MIDSLLDTASELRAGTVRLVAEQILRAIARLLLAPVHQALRHAPLEPQAVALIELFDLDPTP